MYGLGDSVDYPTPGPPTSSLYLLHLQWVGTVCVWECCRVWGGRGAVLVFQQQVNNWICPLTVVCYPRYGFDYRFKNTISSYGRPPPVAKVVCDGNFVWSGSCQGRRGAGGGFPGPLGTPLTSLSANGRPGFTCCPKQPAKMHSHVQSVNLV